MSLCQVKHEPQARLHPPPNTKKSNLYLSKASTGAFLVAEVINALVSGPTTEGFAF